MIGAGASRIMRRSVPPLSDGKGARPGRENHEPDIHPDARLGAWPRSLSLAGVPPCLLAGVPLEGVAEIVYT
jgi:hypothetical protein